MKRNERYEREGTRKGCARRRRCLCGEDGVLASCCETRQQLESPVKMTMQLGACPRLHGGGGGWRAGVSLSSDVHRTRNMSACAGRMSSVSVEVCGKFKASLNLPRIISLRSPWCCLVNKKVESARGSPAALGAGVTGKSPEAPYTGGSKPPRIGTGSRHVRLRRRATFGRHRASDGVLAAVSVYAAA